MTSPSSEVACPVSRTLTEQMELLGQRYRILVTHNTGNHTNANFCLCPPVLCSGQGCRMFLRGTSASMHLPCAAEGFAGVVPAVFVSLKRGFKQGKLIQLPDLFKYRSEGQR